MRIIAKLRSLITSSRRNEKGALLAEYGILVVGVAMAVAGAVWALGDKVLALYDLPAPF